MRMSHLRESGGRSRPGRVVATVSTGRLPRWLRIALVIAVAAICFAAGLYAYNIYTRPTVLTVAVGSIDGDAARVMSAIASRIATSGASVHRSPRQGHGDGGRESAGCRTGGPRDCARRPAEPRPPRGRHLHLRGGPHRRAAGQLDQQHRGARQQERRCHRRRDQSSGGRGRSPRNTISIAPRCDLRMSPSPTCRRRCNRSRCRPYWPWCRFGKISQPAARRFSAQ